ncbi:hypothetical protein SARC_05830 [Sphaeroforma arctica JP610]|uniref:Uncharacterized protein n=1 Tax=Sphaeroforma arctica JP610 TaxID=667725 RepID=A0A0L0FYF7_9EUKA|nr:hypothetical protein SARC_05830 [Sphaeroforma arctica JP610]KNC81870.1 hypothetical protein SARC_05830 [Sphaeroforma arctica JP610]|eukprot:XP_014155772.1 hypothetical protein SARC_05830 [Sphaeroforma arctica JP610]
MAKQHPEWISDQDGHLRTMMHVQEATEIICLIREQLRQLREFSMANVDKSTFNDTVQTTSGDDFLEQQVQPTSQDFSIPTAGMDDTNWPVT